MESSFQGCRLCPHRCGVDRNAGQVGRCRSGTAVRIYRYAPHFGEEPPVSGSHGSGTVFFSHCTLNCIYCQNYRWSQLNEGELYDIADLEDILRRLAEAGCHNWNLVSPTPWLPQIAVAVESLRKTGVSLPVVYNTSGYELTETLDKHAGLADIYLTDLRYADNETAVSGSGVGDYVEISRKALKKMWHRLGSLRCDENGVALSGVICRILVLPDLAHEATANLRWIAENLGTEVPISLMAQYQPAYRALGTAPWNRCVARDEYEAVCETAETLGFENGWFQQFEEPVSDNAFAGYNMRPGGFGENAGERAEI